MTKCLNGSRQTLPSAGALSTTAWGRGVYNQLELNEPTVSRMTLIACVNTQYGPIFLGDLLLSTPDPVNRGIATPLFDAGAEPSLRHVAGIRQKVVVPHPHICMAWAGLLMSASHITNKIAHFAVGKQRIDRQEWMAFLKGADLPSRGDLELILYCWHGTDWSRISNIPEMAIGPFESLMVAGSGTPYFVQHVESLAGLTVTGEALHPYTHAARQIISMAAKATLDQTLDGMGAVEGWGGGFEVAGFEDGSFKKVDRILWLNWIFDNTEEGLEANLMPKFIFQFSSGRETCYLVHNLGSQENPVVHAVSDPRGFSGVQPIVPEVLVPKIAICTVGWNGTSEAGCYTQPMDGSQDQPVSITRGEAGWMWRFHSTFLEQFFTSVAPGRRVVRLNTPAELTFEALGDREG
jgi:hypothetical protein